MTNEEKPFRRNPPRIILVLDDSGSIDQDLPSTIDKEGEAILHDHPCHRGVIKAQEAAQPQRRRDVVDPASKL